ncbi:NACHT domain-containing protein [Pseudarthrobacter chlorophenolicus]|uniref:NACHT domain-containing protein n=1 Tax=Pseudarthrobacter chlorophenolicus TaxID=85085 RepID=UPI000ACD5CA5|nr:hypothetical protein [Pseudarthrobacter chlorophenolicus]
MGDYIYERFTPDRFQAFCSALLVKEYPGYQVFPVGQADGGRDGMAPSRTSGESIAIQVKFKRELKAGEDYYKWLTDAVKRENDSIDRLIKKGIAEYKLVTNVPGTGRADAGTMDRVDKFLKDNINIPAQVLWRDDLDARLSNNYDLKWFYSEVLATPDVVRSLLEQTLGGDNRRRLKAVTSYMRSQYETDAVVKFKQADLQASDLLNLFVDVPGALPTQLKLSHAARTELLGMLEDLSVDSRRFEATEPHMWSFVSSDTPSESFHMRIPPIPAGSLLLHPVVSKRFPRVLVEGAPGQGKSTLAQYLCQVHRMQFLGEANGLRRIPAEHRLSPLRLPFKIDLRDLATWFEGFDPRKAVKHVEHNLPMTLESFIAAEVRFLSGGQDFSVSDLHELAASSPILLILDGFDEIATPAQRASVVREIDKGLVRLTDGALSVQSIVTSRPSAMPDSPTFDRKHWTTIALSSITPVLAIEYAERWASARKLDPREKQELVGILTDKIQAPHMRDLARNPMQLTILLSLIHLRGQSLPDQRTALYQSYIDVFFNREAEKTAVVRDNRQLLIDLHGYLAWIMHSEAEGARSDGRLSSEQLHELIRIWLISRDYAPDAVDELFQGVVQRIVAIVSRVEGTFEFEVQPLREYFAAHHLYHTAPSSPPGNPEPGTKPEILRALLGNAYWQNVLRFFAGFYSVGEIPGLTMELEERLDNRRSPTPVYDRAISVNLLSDWVFHQQPRLTKRIAKASVDELTLRASFGRAYRASADLVLDLPRECGGRFVGELAYDKLATISSRYTAHIVRRHLDETEILEKWLADTENDDVDYVLQHIQRGRLLGVFRQFTADELGLVQERWSNIDKLKERLIAAGCGVAVGGELESRELLQSSFSGNNLFSALGGFWGRFSTISNPTHLIDLVAGDPYGIFQDEALYRQDSKEQAPAPAALEALVTRIENALVGKSQRTSTELAPWQDAISALTDVGAGDSFLAYMFGNIAAGIRSSSLRGKGARDLFDSNVPLTERARHARLRSGDAEWWRSQYESAGTPSEKGAWAMFVCSWVREDLVVALQEELESALAEMPSHQFAVLISCVNAVALTFPYKSAIKSWPGFWDGEHYKVLYVLALRGNKAAQDKIIRQSQDSTDRTPVWARSMVLSWILRRFPHAPSAPQWRELRRDLENLAATSKVDSLTRWGHNGGTDIKNLSYDLAFKLLDQPLILPSRIVDAALRKVAQKASSSVSLSVLALEGRWAANPVQTDS